METIRQDLSVTLMRQIARQLSTKGRVDDRRFTWRGTHEPLPGPPTKPKRRTTANNRQGLPGEEGKKGLKKKHA